MTFRLLPDDAELGSTGMPASVKAGSKQGCSFWTDSAKISSGVHFMMSCRHAQSSQIALKRIGLVQARHHPKSSDCRLTRKAHPPFSLSP